MKFNQVTWYSKLLALILFIALPFIGFYAGMKYQQAVTTPEEIKVGTPSATPKGNNNSTTKISIKTDKLTLKTTYENGILKYSGTVQMPTPCYKLKDETGVLESFPEQVQIRISIVQTRDICAQVITPKEFSGEARVSEKATISVYLNGKKVD